MQKIYCFPEYTSTYLEVILIFKNKEKPRRNEGLG